MYAREWLVCEHSLPSRVVPCLESEIPWPGMQESSETASQGQAAAASANGNQNGG